MADSLGGRIRGAREAAGLRAADLAERVGLSASAYSLIENNKRNVKAHEATAIARALGVSVLALLDESIPTAAAARSATATHVAESALLQRLNQIQDLRLALPASTRSAADVWDAVPDVSALDEFEGARALADWALGTIGRYEHGVGRFVGLAEELGVHLGVDVIVERFADDVIGAVLLNRSYPTILVNATQRRQRSLFTLAHELGHLLASNDGGINVDGEISSTSPDERRANTFAAEFLFPRAQVRDIVLESDNKIAPALARMMDRLDGSYRSCVYRLHNLGYMNARGRDALIDLGRARFIESLEDDALRIVLQSRSDELSPRSVLPTQLLGVLKHAYREGMVSAGPIASLTGEPVEVIIDALAPTLTAPDVPVDVVSAGSDGDDEAFVTGFPG